MELVFRCSGVVGGSVFGGEQGFIKYKSGNNLTAKATMYLVLPDLNLRVQFRMVPVSKMSREGDQNE